MANVKISELPAATSVATTDSIPIVQSGITKRGTFSIFYFLSTLTGAIARLLFSKLDDFVNVADFGAVGDGVTNDSSAFTAAIAALPTNGGTLYLQNGKSYAVNLTITKANVHICGAAGVYDNSTDVALVPFTTSSFVLTVGDGTTLCRGFKLSNVTLNGGSSGNYGLKINGADRCAYHNVAIKNFDTQGLYITSSASQSTTYQFFDNFSCTTRNGASSVGVDILNGGTFTTACFFSNFTIGGTSGALYAMQVDGTTVFMNNGWFSVSNNKGLNSKNTGIYLFSNVTVDSSSSSDVVVEVDTNVRVSQRYRGQVNIDGLMKTTAGNTAALTGNYQIPGNAFLNNPFIQNNLYFTDSALSAYLQQDSSDQLVSLTRSGDRLDISNSGTTSDIRAIPGSGTFIVRRASISNPSVKLQNTSDSVDIIMGSGDPSGVVSAGIGSLFLRYDGGVGSTLYVKQSDDGGNTGWAAK